MGVSDKVFGHIHPAPIAILSFSCTQCKSWIQIRSDPELFSQVESGKIVPDPNLTLDQDPGPQQCLYIIKEKNSVAF